MPLHSRGISQDLAAICNRDFNQWHHVSFLIEWNAPLFCSKCGCCSTSSLRNYISAISTCLIVSLSVCRAAEASRERNAIVSFSKLSCSIILFFFPLFLRRTTDCGSERWPPWRPRTPPPWWARPWEKRAWAPASWRCASSSSSSESSLASWPCRDTNRQSTVTEERMACSGRRVSNTANRGKSSGSMLISLSFFFLSFFFFEKKKQTHEAISRWFVRMERNVVRFKKNKKNKCPEFNSGRFHHRSDHDSNHHRRAVLSVLPSFLNDLPKVAPVFSLVVCGNGFVLAECLKSLTDYLLILYVFWVVTLPLCETSHAPLLKCLRDLFLVCLFCLFCSSQRGETHVISTRLFV